MILHFCKCPNSAELFKDWNSLPSFFPSFLPFYLFIYLFMAVLGLCCCTWAFFSSPGKSPKTVTLIRDGSEPRMWVGKKNIFSDI